MLSLISRVRCASFSSCGRSLLILLLGLKRSLARCLSRRWRRRRVRLVDIWACEAGIFLPCLPNLPVPTTVPALYSCKYKRASIRKGLGNVSISAFCFSGSSPLFLSSRHLPSALTFAVRSPAAPLLAALIFLFCPPPDRPPPDDHSLADRPSPSTHDAPHCRRQHGSSDRRGPRGVIRPQGGAAQSPTHAGTSAASANAGAAEACQTAARWGRAGFCSSAEGRR